MSASATGRLSTSRSLHGRHWHATEKKGITRSGIVCIIMMNSSSNSYKTGTCRERRVPIRTIPWQTSDAALLEGCQSQIGLFSHWQKCSTRWNAATKDAACPSSREDGRMPTTTFLYSRVEFIPDQVVTNHSFLHVECLWGRFHHHSEKCLQNLLIFTA